MSRWKRSLTLARTSWRVVRADRELLWLPVLAYGVSGVVALVAVAVIGATDVVDSAPAVAVAVGLAGALAVVYTWVFVKAAIVSAANERLTGGDPTVATGLAGARAVAGKLLGWAAIEGTVGWILSSLRSSDNPLASIIGMFADVAWKALTFLVLPAIVLERHGARGAIKRSSSLLKATWGENLVAQAGIGLLTMLAIIVAVPVVMAVGALSQIAALAIAVGWTLVVVAVNIALSAVYQTALYRYAVDGVPPELFAEADLRAVFAAKR